jgi:hypothetical protein
MFWFSRFYGSEKKSPLFNNESTTRVFVWSTTARDVGHVAIQVGGNQPKMNENEAGEYISIHPDKFPSFGPTSVIPLPAQVANTLTEDMFIAAASKDKQVIDDPNNLPRIEVSNQKITSLPPDLIYEIKGLDTKKMQTNIQKLKEEVKSGKTVYQLLPKVNIIKLISNFLEDGSSFIGQDPVDVELARRKHDAHPTEPGLNVYNCATLVADILAAGGKLIEPSRTPWGLTPNGVADQVSQDGQRTTLTK